MKLTKLKTYVFESFWFRPLIISLVCLIASEVLVQIEKTGFFLTSHNFLNLSVDGSRAILTTIGTAILGVAAMSFSLTASTMSTVSSSYGARLARNFMDNKNNQVVLGIFSGTFLYSLWTLRYVRNGSDGAVFVPGLAVYGAILLAVICIVSLIYFIHQISQNIQISTLLNRIRNDIHDSLKAIDPEVEEKNLKALESKVQSSVFNKLSVTKMATKEGYIQLIDNDKLASLALENNFIAKLLVQVGDYVHRNKAIIELSNKVSDEVLRKIFRCFSIGEARTPHQDIRFAFQQPVDVICRALSPGINDPFTAINAMDILESGLIEYSKKGTPIQYVFDKDNKARVLILRADDKSVISDILTSLDDYCMEDSMVKRRYLQLRNKLRDIGYKV